MSAELDAKWLELVAAGRAEWSPGMLDTDGGRVVDPGRLMTAQKKSVPPPVWQLLCGPLALPDFTDPPTLGALLGQVRERYMDPTIYARPHKDGWQLFNALGPLDPRGRPRSASSEAGALLCGLELAP